MSDIKRDTEAAALLKEAEVEFGFAEISTGLGEFMEHFNRCCELLQQASGCGEIGSAALEKYDKLSCEKEYHTRRALEGIYKYIYHRCKSLPRLMEHSIRQLEADLERWRGEMSDATVAYAQGLIFALSCVQIPLDGSAWDDLLTTAVDMMFKEDAQGFSVAWIQRRLKIGYARAGRIMDQLEELGVAGPFNGNMPRSILISPEEWVELRAKLGL